MKTCLTILLPFTLIFLICCSEDVKNNPTPVELEDEWPTFVDTGANLVAYKVDGKVRVAKNISRHRSSSHY